MIEGILTAAGNMVARMVQQELVANNLANVTTTGYKKDRLFFQEVFDPETYNSLSDGEIAAKLDSVTVFDGGPLEPTQNPLDLAIVGDGFFSVETGQGVRYTRNGTFSLDNEGYLVNFAGDRVLGEAGAIALDNEQQVTVTPSGEVWQNNSRVDRLALVRFSDPQALEKSGDSLFRATGEGEAVAPEEVTVRQGYREGSNVRAIEEMVEMISIIREYEADQRAIQYQDDTLRRAVNDLGRMG